MIKMLFNWIAFGLLVLILIACRSEDAETSAIANDNDEAAPTALPTANSEDVVPTVTLPPTTTPSPTATATSLPEPTQMATAVPDDVPTGMFTLASQEPVLAAGDGGEWARSLHNAGAVLFHDGQFHMFRNGYQSLPGNAVIGYATSPDGVDWTHFADNPVFQTDDVPYADVMIMASSALVTADGTWVLYFLIWDTPETPGAIGRATAPSPTGPWTPDAAPVLEVGSPGAWDSELVTQPIVLPDEANSGYVMYYTGVDQKNVARVGLATSSDGVSWTKYDDPATDAPPYAESDPVLQPGDPGEWDDGGAARGRVVQTPDGLVMMYRTPALGLGFTYGLAVSEDGIHWTKHPDNPNVERDALPGAPALFFPAFVYHDGTYYFYIEAYNGQSQIYLLTRKSPLAVAAAGEATVHTLVTELPSATGGLAVDAAGNIYAANIGVAPARNGREIYRIMPDGRFELWVEDQALNGASGNTFDQQGNLLQSSLRANVIHRVSPDGTVATFVEEGVRSPVGIAAAPDSTLFVANCGSNTILRVTPNGESAVFSDSSLMSCPNGITLDDAGNVYVANFKNGRIVKITPDGEATEFATVPGSNNGHILFLDGLLYVAARRANQIYTLTLDGELTLLAGTGEAGHADGLALQATFSLPNDIVASPDGRRLYINEAFPTNGVTNSPSVIRVIELPRVE